MTRAVTLAAKSPVYEYYLSTRIVAPDVKAAIAHARACNVMWNEPFVIVSDEETDEPLTDAGDWPRQPRFDMTGLVSRAKEAGEKLRVVAACKPSLVVAARSAIEAQISAAAKLDASTPYAGQPLVAPFQP